MANFYEACYQALMCDDPLKKVVLCQTLYKGAHQKNFENTLIEFRCPKDEVIAGRPLKPELVPVNALVHRKLTTPKGKGALIHALAHIEFNAINLALDACFRFQGLPPRYYQDWILVAKEEAYHFSLLREHLMVLGYDYGDFPAHNGLWEMAQKTAFDPMVRMACVPRLMEARGLDVAPNIQEKLLKVGDKRAADILEIIMRDEVGHVAIGNYWFHYFCQQRNVCPLETFKGYVKQFAPNFLKEPFDLAARKRAGFTQNELELIQHLAQ